MPEKKLDDPERRRLTLAVLRGESPSSLAREYNVTPQYVHKLRSDAKKNVEAKYDYWREVHNILIGGEK